MPIVFSLFIVMPIIEMVLLIRIGAVIGIIPTVGLVLATAVIGLALLRREGMSTMRQIQLRMAAGELPGVELIEGGLLLIGGALLLTPGFVTDTIGFSLLLPPSRRFFARQIADRAILSKIHVTRHGGPGTGFGDTRDGRTIDGEFEEEKRRDPPPRIPR